MARVTISELEASLTGYMAGCTEATHDRIDDLEASLTGYMAGCTEATNDKLDDIGNDVQEIRDRDRLPKNWLFWFLAWVTSLGAAGLLWVYYFTNKEERVVDGVAKMVMKIDPPLLILLMLATWAIIFFVIWIGLIASHFPDEEE